MSVGESAVELAKHSARVKQSGLHMRIWENKETITEIFTDCLNSILFTLQKNM